MSHLASPMIGAAIGVNSDIYIQLKQCQVRSRILSKLKKKSESLKFRKN